jgi:hypothetical protein
MLEKVTNHIEHGLSRLISQYKGKPRLEALLTSYLRQAQQIEDTIWDIIESRLVDSATGAQLQTLAKLVGQPIVSADDDVLRLYVRTRIRINRSHGRPNDVIDVALLLLGDTEFRYREVAPRNIIVDVLDALTADATTIVALLRLAKAGGFRLRLFWAEEPAEEGFTFGSGVTATEDEDRGWADEAETIGGKWIAVS